MNKKKIFTSIVLFVVIGVLVGFGSSLSVFADLYGNEGTGAGSGGVATDGTGMFLSTSYGSTWDYVTIADVAAGLVPGAHMEGDDVVIEGWSGSGNFSVAGARITGCGAMGGFYRYSMVAQKNLGQYKAGDLVGVIGIDGNDPVYNSEMLGGGMNYIGNNWQQVTDAYRTYQDAGIMSLGVGTGRNLSWFCAGDGGTPTEKPAPTCGVTGGTTIMTTRVLNPRLAGAYSGWRTETYAMPTDDLSWYNCYGPGVQTMYGRRNDTLRKAIVDGGVRADYEPGHPEHPFADKYDAYCDTLSSWTNSYTGSTTMAAHWNAWENYWWLNRSFAPYYSNGSQPSSYALGDSTGRRLDEKYIVNTSGDVGTVLSETTGTGSPIYFGIWGDGRHTWLRQSVECKISVWHHRDTWHVKIPGDHAICQAMGIPLSQCFYEYDESRDVYVDQPSHTILVNEHDSDYIIGSLDTGPTGSYADAKVPYNFQNEPFVTLGGDSNYVYAGDTIDVSKAYVMVGAKGNAYTEAFYSTIVKNASVKMISYLTPTPGGGGFMSGGDLCAYVNAKRCNTVYSQSGLTLNGGGSLTGSSTDVPGGAGKYQAYDASAGDYMCFAIAVYPATSGPDYNYSDPGGDHRWAVSRPACKKIIKTPFFGIEGGSLYSIPDVVTGSISKTNIYGRTDLPYYGKISGDVNRLYFGSYVEQSIFGINKISGLASGSGYLGWIGISNNDFCKNLVPLTFANAGTFKSKNNKTETICSSVQEAGHMGDVDKKTVDKAAYVDFWLRDVIDTGDTSYSDGFGNSKKLYSNTGKHIYLTETTQPITSLATTIPDDMTRIIKVKNNTITINGDIKYNSLSRSITSGGNVSQVIIYAKNINISCNVNEIDAILIAEGAVDTCYENTNHNPNDARASRRLNVLGVVITDKIYLDRTYGAAIDGYTYSPAELFMYDTSILLWARYMASAGESNTMTEVYRTEMAPRF